jgi:hypothetical protein
MAFPAFRLSPGARRTAAGTKQKVEYLASGALTAYERQR